MRSQPVRQQWLFENECRRIVPTRTNVDVKALAPLGASRNLFDSDGALRRKVRLTDLEAFSMGPDGAKVLAKKVLGTETGTLVVIDDIPESRHPIISDYRNCVIEGISFALGACGVRAELYRETSAS